MAVIEPILNKKTSERVKAQLESGGVNLPNLIFKYALLASLLFALLVLGILVYDVFTDSWSVFSSRLGTFLANPTRVSAEESGVFQGLRGTFWIGIFVIFLTFPMGIAAAVYLEEYASDNLLTRIINVNIRNLAGVPSVVYGILGFTIFVSILKGVYGDIALSRGNTTTAGGLTLAILALPVVIITSAEAIKAVPDHLREAAYGVGATKSEVIRSHILPYAAPGILTGTLLSLGRALGEAAPLILVGAVQGKLGSRAGFFELGQLGEKFTAMPIVITDFAKQPGAQWQPVTSAAIVVLLLVVLGFNAAAVLLRNRFEGKREG
ncbi:MAG: phosphate ABC transporter permease PstA [Acidimicrobiales bacterium]